MEFNPEQMEQRDVYRLLEGSIIPRPIAWVSTQDRDGINNLAPFSFFNGVSSRPPSVSVSVSYNRRRDDGRKDTLRNILDTGEFVVNIVTEETAAAMAETSFDHPAEVDEFSVAGLTAAPCRVVRPPRVAESPISLECVLHDTMQVGEGPGSSVLVVGIVRSMHIRDEVLNEQGGIDLARVHFVGRLSGHGYTFVREIFELSDQK